MQGWHVLSRQSLERRLSHIALAVALASAIAVLALSLVTTKSDKISIRGMESNVAFTVQKMLRGVRLYTDPCRPPFDVSQYGPLYYYACYGACRVLSASPSDPVRITQVGRAISLLLALAHVVLAYLLMRRILRIGLTWSLLGCAFIYVCCAPWNFVARPEALQAVCMTGCVLLFVASLDCETDRPRASWALLAGAILVGLAGGFAKQNAILAPGLVILFEAWRRRWRRASAALVLAVIPGLICTALLWWYYGPALKANVVDGLRNGLSLRCAFSKVYRPFFTSFALLAVSALLIVPQWLTKETRPAERFLACGMVVYFAYATLGALKYGAAENYYNDFLVLSVVSIAAVLDRREQQDETHRPDGKALSLLAAGFAVFLLPVVAVQHVHWYGFEGPQKQGTYGQRRPVAQFVKEKLAGDPQAYVLAMDRGVSLLLPTRCLFPQPEVAIACFKQGSINYSRFAVLVSSGRVRYVVTRKEEGPKRFLGVELQGYELLREVRGFRVYQRGSPSGGAAGSPDA